MMIKGGRNKVFEQSEIPGMNKYARDLAFQIEFQLELFQIKFHVNWNLVWKISFLQFVRVNV